MGMHRDEDPQLWDLLGRSKGPAPSAFFSRNVVRNVRAQGEGSNGVSTWFKLPRLMQALSAVTAVVIIAFTFQLIHPHNRDHSARPGFAAVDIQDLELAADLDLLVNDDDSDDTLLL